MPCIEDFRCVTSSVLSQLAQNAWESDMGYLYLQPHNLHYIFTNYVQQVEQETGLRIDPDTFSLDSFARLIYECYIEGVCKYENFLHEKSRLEQALLIEQWNRDTIGSLVFAALKLQRFKVNWLKRVRDPMYGKREFNSIFIAKPAAYRYEQNKTTSV
jgi:hypothetical protein